MLRREILDQFESFSGRGGAWDVSARTRLRITGRDRRRFLNNLCTAKLMDVPDGAGCEAFFLDAKGLCAGHGAILLGADEAWIETGSGQGAALIGHFQQYVVSEKVAFEDLSRSTSAYLLCGPGLARNPEIAHAAMQLSANDRFAHCSVAVNGQRILCSRTDLLGPVGYLLIADRQAAGDVGEILQVEPASDELLEALRIEAGCPVFGRDIDSRNLPQEVNRDALAISFTKGCYLGQETVARLDALGHVNKKLLRLEFDSDQLPPPDFRVELDGKAIARVTSAAYSPATGRPLALAYVRRGFETPGTELETGLGRCTVRPLTRIQGS